MITRNQEKGQTVCKRLADVKKILNFGPLFWQTLNPQDELCCVLKPQYT